MAGQADETMDSSRPDVAAGQSAGLRSALASGQRALHFDGDLRASRDHFQRAYQLAEVAGEVEAMAEAALGLAGLWVSEHRTVVGAAQLEERLRQVLTLLDPRSSLVLRIRARLAGEADYVTGGHDRILLVLDEVRATADPVALADALSLAHHCLLGPGDLPLRRDLAAELIRVSFRTGRRSDRLMGLMWQTVDSYAGGDPHAGRMLGELRDQLGQRNHPAVAFIVSAIDVMLAIRAGTLDEAERLAGVCALSGASAGDIDSEWWPGAQLGVIRWFQGRLTELTPVLREVVDSPALSAVDYSALSALAVATAQAGDQPEAASYLAALAGRGLDSLPRSSSWLSTVAGVTEAAYLVGDGEVARQAYGLLSPFGHLPAVGGLGVICLGSVQYFLGTAALADAELDLAIDHLRAAVRHNLSLAHWPALAASRRRLADALTRRGGPDDAEAAARERGAAEAEAVVRGLTAPGFPAAEPAGSAVGSVTCQREGRRWRLGFGERTVTVDDSVGMLHLVVLLANPRRDVAAADLAAGVAALGELGSGLGGYGGSGGDSGGLGGSPQPLLDAAAIGEYRDRLRELDQAAPGEAAKAERDWLVAQLANATGLHGRTRAFPDDAERARVAVGKAIRRALARIASADPVLGEHLRQSVRTGRYCSYWPA
jgi:hypothetical protein